MYEHQGDPILERTSNKYSWEKVRDIEGDLKLVTIRDRYIRDLHKHSQNSIQNNMCTQIYPGNPILGKPTNKGA